MKNILTHFNKILFLKDVCSFKFYFHSDLCCARVFIRKINNFMKMYETFLYSLQSLFTIDPEKILLRIHLTFHFDLYINNWYEIDAFFWHFTKICARINTKRHSKKKKTVSARKPILKIIYICIGKFCGKGWKNGISIFLHPHFADNGAFHLSTAARATWLVLFTNSTTCQRQTKTIGNITRSVHEQYESKAT